MPITLITGANKGLGHETARRLVDHGHTVVATARDPAKGRAAADALGAAFVALDVTDDASVAAAAHEVERTHGKLDVLINNAGITGPYVSAPEAGADDLRAVFETNTFGVVRVTRAFLPLLERSQAPVIVNVSSGMGSMTITSDPQRLENGLVNVTYSPAKAALNMITTQYARALPHMRVNAVDPGYTATDLNHHVGTQTVTEGTDRIVALARAGAGGPTGTFSDRHGPLAW